MVSSIDTFRVECPECDQVFTARRQWAGREVLCPHCRANLRLTAPRHDGPARAAAAIHTGRVFSFGCPRCSAMLEAFTDQSGSTAACPGCATRFQIPTYEYGTARIGPIIVESKAEDPTPVHAYAASGGNAPAIVGHGEDARILCPRCQAENPIEAGICVAWATPFASEAVPKMGEMRAQQAATASFVVALVSLPLCALIFPAVVAVLLGLVAISRGQYSGRIPPLAIAGTVMGVLCGGMGVGMLIF